jgi:hypothetical protein
MNWKEIINTNFSRKAEIVLITIVALVYIVTAQPPEGKALEAELVKWAIWGTIAVGLFGIASQTLLDWKHPKNGKNNGAEIPKAELPPTNRVSPPHPWPRPDTIMDPPVSGEPPKPPA